MWKTKKIFERTIPEIVRVEQYTINYWFYFTLPKIPDAVWEIYQELKRCSRTEAREREEMPSKAPTKQELMQERYKRAIELVRKGKGRNHFAIEFGVTPETSKRYIDMAKHLRREEQENAK